MACYLMKIIFSMLKVMTKLDLYLQPLNFKNFFKLQLVPETFA